MSYFYDRKGTQISQDEYFDLSEHGEYHRVKEDAVERSHYISTVWLGVDMGWDPERPLIFETNVFTRGCSGPVTNVAVVRYSSEQDAFAGHEALVSLWAQN